MKVFENQKKIPASSKEIFKAFEDPSLLAKWWGPSGFTCTFDLFEFKPQGKWSFVMHGPNGTDYPNEMEFKEISAPNRLVIRHTVEPYFTLTVTIEDIEGSAIINWHQDFDNEEVARNIAHIIKPANEQILEKLQALVASCYMKERGDVLDIPKIVQVDEQLTAVIHITIPRAEIQSVMDPAIREVIACLTAQGITPTGALFSYHLNRPTDIFDFEVGFPVAKKITPVGRVKASNLPAAQVARTVYRGGYEGLGTAWGEFFDWIKDEGLNVQASLWECYLSGPEYSPDSSMWITELNSPLM